MLQNINTVHPSAATMIKYIEFVVSKSLLKYLFKKAWETLT